jgi:hypothetical protein
MVHQSWASSMAYTPLRPINQCTGSVQTRIRALAIDRNPIRAAIRFRERSSFLA